MTMRKLLVLPMLCAGLSAWAKVPDWPSDFWQSVTNHLDAVTPSGAAVGTASTDVSTFSCQILASEPFGTADEPFSTILPIFAESPLFWLDATAPGFLLFFR